MIFKLSNILKYIWQGGRRKWLDQIWILNSSFLLSSLKFIFLGLFPVFFFWLTQSVVLQSVPLTASVSISVSPVQTSLLGSDPIYLSANQMSLLWWVLGSAACSWNDIYPVFPVQILHALLLCIWSNGSW